MAETNKTVDKNWDLFIGYLRALRNPTDEEIVEAALVAAIDEDLLAELADNMELLELQN